jgi:hypothetical protein
MTASGWGNRVGGASVIGLAMVLGLAWSCGRDAPATEDVRSALTAPATATFQDGINAYGGTADTQIVQNAAGANYGSATSLNADGDEPGGSGSDTAILLRWDVSSIPPGSTIQSASVTLRVTNASGHDYPLLALGRAWSESGATWREAASGESWQTAGAQGAGDRDATVLGTLSARSTGTNTVTLNAAGLATLSGWVGSPARNFGLIVASASNTDGVDVASRENTTVANRPRLTVVYLPPEPAGGASGGAGGGAGVAGGGAAGTANGAGGSAGAGGGSAGAGGGSSGVAGASGGGGVAGAGGTAGGAPSVLYAVGDVTDCELTADTATARLVDGSTDPIALLGDIAYPDGSASDFANCFDPPWGRHKARIHPAPGNHEYQTAGASGYFGYFGAAAGDPTKGYYSYDVGTWHIVSLNSNCADVSCGAGSAQEQWLRQDLAAHPAACTLAYWHHPRFSSGHNGNATNMTALWQALMDANAELVLAGHDHGYQRLFPLSASGAMVANGIVEFVVGTGGAPLNNGSSFAGTKPANTAVRNANTNGVLKLTLRDGGYDWQFLPIAGQTFSDSGSASCH